MLNRIWGIGLAFALVASGCAEGANAKHARRPDLGGPRTNEPDGDTEGTDGGFPFPDADEGSTGEPDATTGGDDAPTGQPAGTLGCEAIDLLFVVDNTEGMREPQRRLERSVPEFVAGLRNTMPELGSFHIGVTTVDNGAFNDSGCQTRGALVTRTGGDDSSNAGCGPYAEGHPYMTEADDLEDAFECAVRVGTDGGFDERPIESAIDALNPAMNFAGACNDGFVRDEALLVVVVLSNEDDMADLSSPGSTGEPADWYDDLVALKGGNPGRISILSIVGHAKPNNCPSFQWNGFDGAEIATRIITMTQMFPHWAVGDLCRLDYDDFFDDATPIVRTACDEMVVGGSQS
jgi:hypothetical protein